MLIARSAVISAAAALISIFSGASSFCDAQTADDVIASDGEQITERPLACPMYVQGGAMGFWFGYENAGYSWPDSWELKDYLDPVNHASAKYVPAGDPYYVVSRHGEARWYDPAFIAHCELYEVSFLGYVVQAHYAVIVDQNLGRVVPCGTGSTGGPIEPSYDLTPGTPPAALSMDGYGSGCSDAPPDGGGGGGPATGQVCTTVRTDYYWYYPDTGQFEYRYSDETTSCTAMT